MNSEFPFITFISLFADDLRLLPVAYDRNEGQLVRLNSDEVEAAISFAIEPSLSSGHSGQNLLGHGTPTVTLMYTAH